MSATELDPAIRDLVASTPLMDLPELSAETLEQFRAMEIPAELSDAVERVDLVVREDPRLVVRVHTPKGPPQAQRPCVYSIHGGGYVAGSVDIDDALFDDLCQKTGCVGVSVDYRLAPRIALPRPARGLLCRARLGVRERGTALGDQGDEDEQREHAPTDERPRWDRTQA